jgi:hypothetical protein
MTIRDLLVQIDQTQAARHRLEAGLKLAERFGAHLTALCLAAEPFMRSAAGFHLPADVVREHLRHTEAEAKPVFAAARQAAEQGGTSPPVVKELSSAVGCPRHPMIMVSDGPTRVKPGPAGHRRRRHGLDSCRSAGSSASIGCKGRYHPPPNCTGLIQAAWRVRPARCGSYRLRPRSMAQAVSSSRSPTVRSARP